MESKPKDDGPCAPATWARKVEDVAIVVPEPLAHPAPVNVSSFLKPNEVTDFLVHASHAKCERTWVELILAGFMGGCLLSFGGFLMVVVAGGSSLVLPPGLVSLLAGLVFPVGLVMIVLTGVDLLTSNMMYTTVPFLELAPREVFGKRGASAWLSLGRLLSVSLFANLAGSVMIAACAAYLGGLSPESVAWAIKVAHKKGTLPAGTAFVRGIGANWLVCLAVYMSYTSRTTGGKVAAIWIPISTFVALGFEHSVANCFTIPLGVFLSSGTADAIPFVDLLYNLALVIPGNLVGAVLFIGSQWILTRPPSARTAGRRPSISSIHPEQ
ncbi:Formate/nitrite transporter-domain-containing protein [Hyaloraphidium curvatum]|nr:Formate/nitrite transporter-domain-containing protein [Hyaloraphidium curvatum]